MSIIQALFPAWNELSADTVTKATSGQFYGASSGSYGTLVNVSGLGVVRFDYNNVSLGNELTSVVFTGSVQPATFVAVSINGGATWFTFTNTAGTYTRAGDPFGLEAAIDGTVFNVRIRRL